jgi:hypothetical protein
VSKEALFLVPRAGETDDEQRLREALNRLGGSALGALDSAIGLRTAAPETQRERHRARGAMRDALLMMQEVFSLHLHVGPTTTKPQKPRS